MLIGAFSIGSAGPNVQDFANARGAAFAIYGIIDQVNTRGILYQVADTETISISRQTLKSLLIHSGSVYRQQFF